jgi:hypothetical protein
MKKLVLLLVAGVLLAQMRTRTATGFESIDKARLKADLTFLASDALEGRRSLERGSEVAVQWIASEFAKSGLKPASGDSFLQTVPLIEYTADRVETSLVVKHGDKAETFHAPDAIGNFPNAVTVAGAVVFAGFGITAPELGYDDYADLDARGKVVLIFNHEPQENDEKSVFNGTGNTRYTNNYSKVLNAQRQWRGGGADDGRSKSPGRARARSGSRATTGGAGARAGGANAAAYSLGSTRGGWNDDSVVCDFIEIGG